MNGEVAQLVALTAHGSAFLSGGSGARDFYPANTTFVYCNEVAFVEVKKFIRAREEKVAVDPNAWFLLLKDGGCRRLRLGHQATPSPRFPDRMMAGFVGGGGRWFIAAAYPDHTDNWLARWEVSAPDAPDRKIWKVTYGKVSSVGQAPRAEAPDLRARSDALESVLTRTESFARTHDAVSFADCFRRALDSLTSDAPEQPYHTDLLPPSGYGTQAKRVLAACAHAWVFGGMGSWNDLGFEPSEAQREYEHLSDELYAAVNRGIEEGANSYGG
jgi:hypothetical protein